MKRVILAISMLVAACSLHAQGTFRFTWHGDSNIFQASFDVGPTTMQPGSRLIDSQEFLASLAITNPIGRVYQYAGSGSGSVAGGLNPWSFGITLFNFGTGTELLMSGGEPPVGAMAGLIHEKPFSGPESYYENGFWTYSAIPEPSSLRLGCAILSSTAWWAWRRKCLHASAA